MSVVGHRIWLHMQDKGPYNKRAFARFLKRKDVLSTTHQSISGWLRKDHPPVYFVNAVVEGLGLDGAEEMELWHLYFKGQSIPHDPRITAENEYYLDEIRREREEERRDREAEGERETSNGSTSRPS